MTEVRNSVLRGPSHFGLSTEIGLGCFHASLGKRGSQQAYLRRDLSVALQGFAEPSLLKHVLLMTQRFSCYIAYTMGLTDIFPFHQAGSLRHGHSHSRSSASEKV